MGRDSAAMKILAVITATFLPSTFIATLFSMEMFNFPRAETGWVSPAFWVYWITSIPLTAGVLIAWRIWWKRQRASYESELERGAESHELLRPKHQSSLNFLASRYRSLHEPKTVV